MTSSLEWKKKDLPPTIYQGNLVSKLPSFPSSVSQILLLINLLQTHTCKYSIILFLDKDF